MTVWVDDMYSVPMGQFRRMKMSHLISDNEKELHAMAGKIGVARRWYQGDHYDICLSKRALAISLGAVEVTMRQLAGISYCLREGIQFDTPAEAYKELRLLHNRQRPRGKSKLGAMANG